jgi:hypothetical protein
MPDFIDQYAEIRSDLRWKVTVSIQLHKPRLPRISDYKTVHCMTVQVRRMHIRSRWAFTAVRATMARVSDEYSFARGN